MRRFLREPLVHFFVLGALLFAWFEWRGGGPGPGSTRIAVTAGVVQHLAAGFARTWQRPPTGSELKGLIDEYVREEIATREAIEMGLDRDDPIVRRRLRQKLEFLVEDTLALVPPTEVELQEWFDRHREAFHAEPRLALRQVFVSTTRRGTAARTEALRLLERLESAGPGAAIDAWGDPSLLPGSIPLGPLSEVARLFGDAFAAQVVSIAPGRWTGPIESPYGFHLVLVPEREDAAPASLSSIRPLVEREFLAERRRSQVDGLYEKLLGKYTVAIEMPEDPGTVVPVGAPGAGSP